MYRSTVRRKTALQTVFQTLSCVSLLNGTLNFIGPLIPKNNHGGTVYTHNKEDNGIQHFSKGICRKVDVKAIFCILYVSKISKLT